MVEFIHFFNNFPRKYGGNPLLFQFVAPIPINVPVLCSFFQCKFLFLFSRFLEIYKVKGKPITREGLVKPSCLRLLYSLRILNTETLYKEQTVKKKDKTL